MMNVSEILCKAGLRITRQRETVLRLMLENGFPMSHAEINGTLDKPLDKVTLYRTLQALTDAGIVHQVQGLDGAWRFCAHDAEAEGCPGGHPHFLCLGCGKMTCLSNQSIPRVEVPEGVKVDGKQLVVYGYCAECGAK